MCDLGIRVNLYLFYCSNPPELSPERYGISASSDEQVDVNGLFYGGSQHMTVSELLEQLEKHYCDSIAAEFQHLQVIKISLDHENS